MNCPIDGTALQMADRQGIEIDYCPQCRGVWLERRELDKLVERARADPAQASASPARQRNGRQNKSWLGEIFD